MFQLSSEKIDIEKLRIQQLDGRAGAFVTFEGWVRNHNDGRSVDKLDYEAFAPLANKEGNKIINEAFEKYEVINICCIHRIGSLEIGDLAVWAGVSAAHRGAAFEACQYIIDEVKTRVPIWKREYYSSGEVEWVNCTTLEKQRVP